MNPLLNMLLSSMMGMGRNPMNMGMQNSMGNPLMNMFNSFPFMNNMMGQNNFMNNPFMNMMNQNNFSNMEIGRAHV